MREPSPGLWCSLSYPIIQASTSLLREPPTSQATNMNQSSESQVLGFLKELLEIQRKYANELKNAKTNRQEEVRELLDKSVAREVADAN